MIDIASLKLPDADDVSIEVEKQRHRDLMDRIKGSGGPAEIPKLAASDLVLAAHERADRAIKDSLRIFGDPVVKSLGDAAEQMKRLDPMGLARSERERALRDFGLAASPLARTFDELAGHRMTIERSPLGDLMHDIEAQREEIEAAGISFDRPPKIPDITIRDIVLAPNPIVETNRQLHGIKEIGLAHAETTNKLQAIAAEQLAKSEAAAAEQVRTSRRNTLTTLGMGAAAIVVSIAIAMVPAIYAKLRGMGSETAVAASPGARAVAPFTPIRSPPQPLR